VAECLDGEGGRNGKADRDGGDQDEDPDRGAVVDDSGHHRLLRRCVVVAGPVGRVRGRASAVGALARDRAASRKPATRLVRRRVVIMSHLLGSGSRCSAAAVSNRTNTLHAWLFGRVLVAARMRPWNRLGAGIKRVECG
jgi:hypothetical protein